MCDTIVALCSATAAGSVLFGKNSDRQHDESQHLAWHSRRVHEAGARVRLTHCAIEQVRHTHALLISKPHWIWGAEVGANEHGLVIGNEALFSKIQASPERGIIGMDYLRLALERAENVEEGIEVITTLLGRHGQAGNCGFRREIAYHNSFILADPNGAKVLETVDREWAVRSVTEYDAISNAFTIESRISAASRTCESNAIARGLHRQGATFDFRAAYEDESRAGSGRYRRGRAMHLLGVRNGNLRPMDLFRILRDHEEGPSAPGKSPPRICIHAAENLLGQTTASWVATLARGRTVHWVTGTAAACTGLFKPVLVETGLPDHGPRPGADEDQESLWWRHEQFRRFLDRSDDDTRSAFMAARDTLEARFDDKMSACPAPTDQGSRRDAADIVEACWREAMEFESQWYSRLSSQASASGIGN